MIEPWLYEILDGVPSWGSRGLAVDIGANEGSWSAWMSQHFKQVLAIDADQRCIDDLRSRFVGSLEHANVEVIHAAVSAGVGETTLFQRPSPNQSSLLERHPIGGNGCEEAPVIREVVVPTLNLDAIAISTGCDIDLIKVDVEGAEAAVLSGATLPMFRRSRWIIEIHDTSSDVLKQVERLGYQQCTRVSHPCPSAHPAHYWVYLEPQC